MFSLGWIDAPRPVVAGSYVALGWLALIAAPQLVRTLDAVPVAPDATARRDDSLTEIQA